MTVEDKETFYIAKCLFCLESENNSIFRNEAVLNSLMSYLTHFTTLCFLHEVQFTLFKYSREMKARKKLSGRMCSLEKNIVKPLKIPSFFFALCAASLFFRRIILISKLLFKMMR